jgi:DNA-binding GntR family transcriptional regulator
MTTSAIVPEVTGIASLHPESLGDLAYRALRAGILSGTLAPGTELNEVRLSEQLGVSRTPLRDAIKRLDDVGLVEARPRRQARVRSFSPSDLTDIYNTRLGLEGAAVRLCTAGRISLEEPRRVLAELDALDSADASTIANLEHAFHSSLVDAAGNSALIRAYAAIGAQLQTALLYLRIYGPDHRSPDAVASAHRAIVEAIESGDERAALDAIQVHIRDATELALASLGADSAGLLRPTRDLY